MAESNDVRALEKIFTEVDESKVRIIFSDQCIKAQAFLVNKLKKQTEQQKEICSFISSGNVKLEAEIKIAEQEIKNMLIAHETIKSANIEMRKEWFLKKEEKIEITGRIELGEKKYEELWLSTKSRYENIPYVQKCLQGKNRSQLIQANIKSLMSESESLQNEIKIKKNTLLKMDQKVIIDLATFVVKDKPKLLKTIHDLSNEIEELTKEINVLEEEEAKINPFSKLRVSTEIQQRPNTEIKEQTKNNIDEKWPSLCKNENDAIVMPRLQLLDVDLDILSVKLDQIKKVGFSSSEQQKVTMMEGINNKHEHEKSDEYDVRLEKDHTLNIISKVNRSQLHNVDFIRSEISEGPTGISKKSDDKVSEQLEMEENEEVNSNKEGGEILVPPTQFIDEIKNSQDKKKVSFDLSMEVTPIDCKEVVDQLNNENIEDNKNNETLTSQGDLNSITEEDFGKIKDKILKQHNLDLSPQFIYAKHSIIHKMMEDKDKVITSKFFDQQSSKICEPSSESEKDNKDKNKTGINKEENESIEKKDNNCNNYFDTSVDKIKMSSPKIQVIEKPVTGFLFNHGSQRITDSLNLSESTTGFEEGDGDFSHCIDSSVLLSPKADVPMEVADDTRPVTSQEIPNFMSGVRKTGLSFFGWSSAETKPDSNFQNTGGNFNFNFSGEEKKNRGGLFSMFR
ncbi:unnamed protein product [Parnassius apollo]|uniref:(apollo) hypothetical protein n=1 Tax=Parnassius apollo TaxID=110799 RepID=A0A8S3XYJ0_PARAO|nr:unnamed protein product [Parnassius apollo]